MTDCRAFAIASVERELAERRRTHNAITGLLSERGGRQPRRTMVFSIRLDSAEVAALERRAATLDLKPSVLARNLIRIGLRVDGADGTDRDVAAAVRRLVAVTEELRALAGNSR